MYVLAHAIMINIIYNEMVPQLNYILELSFFSHIIIYVKKH